MSTYKQLMKEMKKLGLLRPKPQGKMALIEEINNTPLKEPDPESGKKAGT